MSSIMIKAVAEYACPGCMNGSSPNNCSKVDIGPTGCASHFPGTMGMGVGTFALGLPNGFNRFGRQETTKIGIYESYEALVQLHPNLTSIFSLPIWKHLDAHGNTIVRWFSPRTNAGWSSVILGDCRDQLPHAIEISEQQIAEMD